MATPAHGAFIARRPLSVHDSCFCLNERGCERSVEILNGMARETFFAFIGTPFIPTGCKGVKKEQILSPKLEPRALQYKHGGTCWSTFLFRIAGSIVECVAKTFSNLPRSRCDDWKIQPGLQLRWFLLLSCSMRHWYVTRLN